jgi:hypothetical protein
MKKTIASLILVAALAGAREANAQFSGFTLAGHYKNLFISSQTVDGENYFLDTNRLRLEIDKQADPWQFHAEIDNELLLHDFADTPDFAYIRSREHQNLASWDSDKVSVDDDHVYLRHALYRLYVKYFSPEFQAVVGKQAVDWGKMRFYSPMDLFNPLGPIEIERDYRTGVDAVNLTLASDGLSGWNLVIAPGHDPEHARYGLKYYTNVKSYDLEFIAAQIREDQVIGAAFDGQLGGAGFRGEITQNWQQDEERTFARASLGIDYNFSEKTYLLFEQLYNGGHSDNNPAIAFSAKDYLKALSIEKNLSSLWYQYKFNPSLEANLYLIYDWDGESGVANPELKKELTKNTTLDVGAQLFWGEDGGEFGSSNHLYYAQIKWYF